MILPHAVFTLVSHFRLDYTCQKCDFEGPIEHCVSNKWVNPF